MADYRTTLDELFVSKLGYEFVGTELPRPNIDGNENLIEISKEYSGQGVDVIVAECLDRIPEFQKKVIKHHKLQFPNSHFLFISNKGKVFDLYNVSNSTRLRPITYNEIERNTRLFKEKIQLFNVEDAQGAVDLKIKIEKAFDVNDKVTKKFFDRFQKIHEKLQSAISGINDKEDKSWYASVLLNRIMFIYFLQKHNVIQNDQRFLLTKFEEVERLGGDYYKDFLLPLFFLGFAKRGGKEKAAFEQKFGPIRYLNGGLFYPHHIEQKYSREEIHANVGVKLQWVDDASDTLIDVDAAILREILEFLNGCTWYLDSRPMKDEDDINPDVLGYIFERYINEKERGKLGAYYTKEDITDYIARNTIIPFILDTLRANKIDAPDPKPLITNNKDIRAEIADYIEKTDEYSTLKFLYKDVLLPMSVLDPAVGSGAFLFAALNVLLPIYQKAVYKLKQHRGNQNDVWLESLCKTLEQHSEEYYLTKQIILNNLFGVDIVEEATEICKLRLFLQLASHLPDIELIEPLPDIDFNIYAGNSLVGGLSWEDLQSTYGMKLFDKHGKKLDLEKIKQRITMLSEKKRDYRELQQADLEDTDLRTKKNEISKLETVINSDIDIGVTNPLHWFIEFNDIIVQGGFDVVIGNPPYVEYSKIKSTYQIKGYRTEKSGNLYGNFIERGNRLTSAHSYTGLIVPISFSSTKRMESVQNVVAETCSDIWVSHYAERPSKLFEGAEVLLNIILMKKASTDLTNYYSTGFIKWNSSERDKLFNELQYSRVSKLRSYVIPKFGAQAENEIWKKLSSNDHLERYFKKKSDHLIYYRIGGGRYWKIFTDFQPQFKLKGKQGVSSRENYLYLSSDKERYVTIAALSSSLFYWYFINTTNCRDLNPFDLQSFRVSLDKMDKSIATRLTAEAKKLMKDYHQKSLLKDKVSSKTGEMTYQEFYPRLSKPIIDDIDSLLGEHYGFTKKETDFIINYDLKFRMGGDEE